MPFSSVDQPLILRTMLSLILWKFTDLVLALINSFCFRCFRLSSSAVKGGASLGAVPRTPVVAPHTLSACHLIHPHGAGLTLTNSTRTFPTRPEVSTGALWKYLLTLKSWIYLFTQQDDVCIVFFMFACLALSCNVFSYKVPRGRGHAYLSNFPFFFSNGWWCWWFDSFIFLTSLSLTVTSQGLIFPGYLSFSPVTWSLDIMAAHVKPVRKKQCFSSSAWISNHNFAFWK